VSPRVAAIERGYGEAVRGLVLQPGFMVVRPSVPMGSAGALLMASPPG
jgi:hypothetical protein